MNKVLWRTLACKTDIIGVSDLTEWKGESWGRKPPSLWVLFSPSARSWQSLSRFENHQYRLSHSIPITTVGGSYSYPHFIDEIKKWVGVSGPRLPGEMSKPHGCKVAEPDTHSSPLTPNPGSFPLHYLLVLWTLFSVNYPLFLASSFSFCVFLFNLFIITCSGSFLLGTFLARILSIPSICPRRSLYRSGKCFSNYILNYNFKVTYLSYSPRDFS